MTLELTTFDPWKRVDLTIHPSGCSRDTSPTPPGIPRPQCLFPSSRRRHKQDGFDSTLHSGSLSLPRAWGRTYLAQQHESPVGGRSYGHPKYYTSTCWIPWGGTAGAVLVASLSEGVRGHSIPGRWIIWILFSPVHGSLQFDSIPSRKCAVLPPVKPTSVRVVSSLDYE